MFILFIETMTCFLDISLVVMLVWDLDLLLPLIIHWMLSIFFVLRMEKTSLILRTFSELLPTLEAYIYNISWLPFVWDSVFVLKNLEISLISLGVLVGIRRESLSILASLSLSLSLGLLFLTRSTLGVQWKDTFYLKELLLVSVTNESHPAL